MKVCIYGAGAIGGWLGHGLARAGCSVSLVARGTTLDALQLHGLRVRQAGAVTSQAVASSALPAEFSVQDVVVIAVKAPALPAIAA
jgi:2-dehydropantoate 2-reductase